MCLVISLPAGPARADLLDGLYLSAGVGWDYAENIKLDSNGAVINFDQGIVQPSFALGVRFLDDWRAEFEYSMHENAPEILYSSIAAVEIDPDEADSIQASSLMLNVFRDFHVGLAFHPYLGAGIGQTKVDLRFSEKHLVDDAGRPRRDIIDDSDTSVAFQLIAGFSVPISRRFDLAADYRFWHAPSVNLQEVSGASLDTSHSVQSVWLHMRFHAADAGVAASPVPRSDAMQGLYVASSLGGVFSEDAEITGTESVVDAYDLGPMAAIAIGYGWHEHWRFELEGAYRTNSVEVYEVSGAIGEDAASGNLKMTTVMLNVIYQFGRGSSIHPYLGIGGGMARADYKIETKTFCMNFVCGTVEEQAKIVDDHDTAFAAQAILGVDIALTSRLHLTADYRYLLTKSFDLQRPDGSPFEIRQQGADSVSVGFRYAVGS